MTSTVGFIGHSDRGSVNDPLMIVRWGQFIIKFGSFSKAKTLAYGVHGFFNNGGKRCYAVNVAEDEDGKLDVESGLKALDEIDEIEYVVVPGQTDTEVHEMILDHCRKHGDRFAILDLIGEIEEEKEAVEEEETDTGEEETEEEETEEEEEPKGIYTLPELEDREHGVYLFPWILVKDPIGKHDDPRESYINIPVSGHVAGLYVSAEEGSRDPPHDRKIEGAVSLTFKVTDQDQRALNEKGIECLRFHPKELIAIGSHEIFYDGVI